MLKNSPCAVRRLSSTHDENLILQRWSVQLRISQFNFRDTNVYPTQHSGMTYSQYTPSKWVTKSYVKTCHNKSNAISIIVHNQCCWLVVTCLLHSWCLTGLSVAEATLLLQVSGQPPTKGWGLLGPDTTWDSGGGHWAWGCSATRGA